MEQQIVAGREHMISWCGVGSTGVMPTMQHVMVIRVWPIYGEVSNFSPLTMMWHTMVIRVWPIYGEVSNFSPLTMMWHTMVIRVCPEGRFESAPDQS